MALPWSHIHRNDHFIGRRIVRRRLLALEPLEGRQTLSTFTVTNTADSGTGSLRWAITQSDGKTGPNTIKFDIPGNDLDTINLQSALPTINTPVTMDGTSQPGYAGTPLVILNGSLAGSSVPGLMVAASNTTIEGLAIDSFSGSGIVISGTSGDVVAADVIGLTVPGKLGGTPGGIASGNAPAGNGGEGVLILSGATHNTIGGTTPAARDVISSNGVCGVYLMNAGTSGNLVEGDFIGTDASGTLARPNLINGLAIVSGASANTVGGTAAGAGDVISGNTYNGIVIAFAGASNNVVEGDFIGTNAAGTARLPNGADGVVIQGSATGNTIGGTTLAAGDVISGNAGDGVLITDSGTSGNVVEGDFIGTDAGGYNPLGNLGNGVKVAGGASSNTIGGMTAGGAVVPAARNLISGNEGYGVDLSGPGTSGNLVASNNIGLDVTESLPVDNNAGGVILEQGASSNSVDDNVITGNYGVQLLVTDAGTNDNIIFSNVIGINSAGAVILSPSAAWHLDYGLDVFEGPAGTVVWHNVVEDLTSGVSIDDASGTVVLTNQILNCAIGDLSLNNSSGSTIEFNKLSGPDKFNYDGSGQNTIAENTFI